MQRVRVGPLDAEQQGAIADLFGAVRLPGEYATVSMTDLDAVLNDVIGCTAYEVVEQLVGPIGDRAAERRSAAAERNRLWAWLSGHEVVRAQPALQTWVASTRRNGLIERSVERTRAVLDQALCVLGELPGVGTPLPVFVDSVLSDPHGLDEGTRLHTMVVRALAAVYGIDPPSDAGQLRALWDRAGIADDELSSTVLAAGLRITTEGDVIGRILHMCAEAGHAAALTLQQLRASSRIVDAPDRVWVVENPSVLALALARFGARCPPMICTSGWPSSAGVRLLQQLSKAGTRSLVRCGSAPSAYLRRETQLPASVVEFLDSNSNKSGLGGVCAARVFPSFPVTGTCATLDGENLVWSPREAARGTPAQPTGRRVR
ncbi:TIGR02679 family protein [Nocardia sp. NBC_01009]|uniref:TIGR02679 family protein n=1 Tax=Nocardia sp. NBC_01009 TaxID=2975996 RepID=UPI0038630F47|nr:TIGR02679 family protein [Nocardia sp. NBC_01009]